MKGLQDAMKQMFGGSKEGCQDWGKKNWEHCGKQWQDCGK
jgi:hypothetical protein